MDKDEIRDAILESMIVSAEAQLKALKKLRGAMEEEKPSIKSKSQISIVYDILSAAGKPLHVSQIMADAHERFGITLERESVVSALSKKVIKEDRFVRTGKNTFALKAR